MWLQFFCNWLRLKIHLKSLSKFTHFFLPCLLRFPPIYLIFLKHVVLLMGYAELCLGITVSVHCVLWWSSIPSRLNSNPGIGFGFTLIDQCTNFQVSNFWFRCHAYSELALLRAYMYLLWLATILICPLMLMCLPARHWHSA